MPHEIKITVTESAARTLLATHFARTEQITSLLGMVLNPRNREQLKVSLDRTISSFDNEEGMILFFAIDSGKRGMIPLSVRVQLDNAFESVSQAVKYFSGDITVKLDVVRDSDMVFIDRTVMEAFVVNTKIRQIFDEGQGEAVVTDLLLTGCDGISGATDDELLGDVQTLLERDEIGFIRCSKIMVIDHFGLDESVVESILNGNVIMTRSPEEHYIPDRQEGEG